MSLMRFGGKIFKKCTYVLNQILRHLLVGTCKIKLQRSNLQQFPELTFKKGGNNRKVGASSKTLFMKVLPRFFFSFFVNLQKNRKKSLRTSRI